MATQLTQAYLQHKTTNAVGNFAGIITGGDEEEQVPNDELVDEDGEVKISRSSLISYGVILSALATIGLYSAAITIIGGTLLTVAAIVSITTSVLIMGAEFRLCQLETFRGVHNILRKDVNWLAGENVRLSKVNDNLKLQVFYMKETEQRFQDLAFQQGANVENIVRLVKENQILIDEKKVLIREDIVEALIDAAFAAEGGEDGTFSDREIKKLITRIRGLPAVTIDEELLKSTVEGNRSVLSLIELIRDLDVEGDQLGDHIFIIDEDNHKLAEELQVA